MVQFMQKLAPVHALGAAWDIKMLQKENAPIVTGLIAYFMYQKYVEGNRYFTALVEFPIWAYLYYTQNWTFNFWTLLLAVHIILRFCRATGPDEPVEGAVFVTGCDSGMGETTAFHLSKVGYHVYGACRLSIQYSVTVTCANFCGTDPSPINSSTNLTTYSLITCRPFAPT